MTDPNSDSSLTDRRCHPSDGTSLTSEQIAFAKLLGELLAEEWRQEQLARQTPDPIESGRN